MIITLSGPAGAGKGTLARMLAQILGLPHCDFGLIFRAIIYSNFDVNNVKLLGSSVYYRNNNITDILTTEEAGFKAAMFASQLIEPAKLLVKYPNFVCDGRTVGTEIYPNADFHFFITAKREERFNRRFKSGGNIKIMKRREELDEAKLVIPNNAVVVDTTGKTEKQSLEEMLAYKELFVFTR